MLWRPHPTKRGLLLAGGLAAAVICVEVFNRKIERPKVGQPEVVYDTNCEEAFEFALPVGEWWGVSRDFVVLLEMGSVKGRAAMSFGGRELLLSVTLEEQTTVLTKIVDGRRKTFSIPTSVKPAYVDAVSYFLSGERTLTTWDARAPMLRHDGTECLDVDQIVVLSTEGAYGAGQPEFRLNLSRLNDPKERCTPSQLSQLVRLGELLAAKSK